MLNRIAEAIRKRINDLPDIKQVEFYEGQFDSFDQYVTNPPVVYVDAANPTISETFAGASEDIDLTLHVITSRLWRTPDSMLSIMASLINELHQQPLLDSYDGQGSSDVYLGRIFATAWFNELTFPGIMVWGLRLKVVSAGIIESEFAGDDPDEPAEEIIEISDAAGLVAINENLSGSYRLTADIDLSSYTNWEAIGTSLEPFTGIFNGNGKTISNLTISDTTPGKKMGLFSYISGATLYDFNITGASITGLATDHVNSNGAGIIGWSATSSTLSNIHVDGEIITVGDCGGFLCDAGNCTITGCSADVDITLGEYVTTCGVFMCALHGSTVERCYSLGGIVGDTETISSISAFIGASNDSSIINCCSTADVTGAYSLGGILQQGFNTTITNCYYGGTITYGYDYEIGGILGSDTGSNCTITSSYCDTQISGVTAGAGGTDRETHRMIREEFYTDWDFADVWSINEQTSYPYLTGQTPVEPTYNSVTVSSDFADTFIVPSTIAITSLTIKTPLENDYITSLLDQTNTTYYGEPTNAWFGDLTEVVSGDKYYYVATPVRDVVISWT